MCSNLKEFIKKHDIEDLFVIPYFILSIIIPIFFGLFFFLIWIMIHYILEVWKYYLTYRKINIDCLLIAFDHCIVDFFIFFLALNIESFTGISAALSTNAIKSLSRTSKFLEFIEIAIRTIGFIKTSKNIYHIIKHLKSKNKQDIYYTPYKFKLSKKTKIYIFLTFLTTIISIYIHMFWFNENLNNIIKEYIKILFH